MKLKTLEIQHFGKFRGKRIDIGDGLWQWSAANESGKTTAADFIRFMFYGFEKIKGRHTLLQSPLERYQPWDSSEGLAGALEFEDESGALYRIERSMNAKGKGEVRVLDAQGREPDIDNVGEHFLGVDSETFVSVFYIGQGERTARRTAGMDVAMKNLVTTGSEEVSFDAVMEKLEKERLKYSSPKGGGGKLKSLAAETEQLERAIAAAKLQLAQSAPDISPQMIETQIEEIDIQLQNIAERKRAAEGHAAWQRVQKRAALREQLQQLDEEYRAAAAVSGEDIVRLGEMFAAEEEIQKKIEQDRRQAETLRLQITEPDEKDQLISAHRAWINFPRWAVAAIAVSAVVLLAGVIGAVWTPLCLIMAVLGGVGLAVSFVLGSRLPAPLRGAGISNRKELAAAMQMLEWQTENTNKQKQALAALEQSESQHRQEMESLRQKYSALVQSTCIRSKADLEKAKGQAEICRLLRQRIEDTEMQLGELAENEAYDNDIAAQNVAAEDMAELQAQAAGLAEQKEALLRRLTDVAQSARRLEQLEKDIADKQETLALKQQQYQKDKAAYDVVMIAIEQMQAAQTALRDNYAPLLKKALEQNLRFLTDGKYDTVTLDEDFALRIKADGGMRALDYFSAGTRDIAYLALRLALAQIVEGEKRLPLILDDPFVNLDKERLGRLNTMLKEISCQRQILLFSCKDLHF